MKPLRDGIAYIWEGRLDAGSAVTAEARALLSPRERARADRFVYDHHRRRYTVAQAHLRRVLGDQTGDRPANIRFQYGEHGKPFLADGPVFNQSHSSERVMIGVAAEGRLGIDIEKRRTVRLMSEIARKNFAPAESELFRRTPGADRPVLFFQLWTCKEAFLKALGGRAHRATAFLLGRSVPTSAERTRARECPRGTPIGLARRQHSLFKRCHGGDRDRPSGHCGRATRLRSRRSPESPRTPRRELQPQVLTAPSPQLPAATATSPHVPARFDSPVPVVALEQIAPFS